MAIYRVTASVSFEYDSADGLATSKEEARSDVLDMLDSGRPGSDSFDVEIEVVTEVCPRHGGPWGSDETCLMCTDEAGYPVPVTL